jgi:sirohydrochlorin cobaltochelatase
MTRAIILFAHGARDPEWARPFERLRETLLTLAPDSDVELAYLELMQPDLKEAAGRLVTRGATRIDVVPVFMAQGGHLKRDLPLRVEEARALHPLVGFNLRPAIGETQAVIEAMAKHIAGL